MKPITKVLVATVAAGLSVAALPSLAGTTNSVPWFCGFEGSEGYTNLMPLIDGTNGWYASSSNAIVQTNTVCTNGVFANSTNAAMIPIEVTLSNQFNGAAITNLWLQMDVRGVRDDFGEEDHPTVDTNATAMFYISSNGYFIVQHVTNRTGITTNWITITNTVTGTNAVPYDTNLWVRLNVYQNYTNKTWALFANYKLITNSINFVSTNVIGFGGFDLYNGNGATTYLDNVSVTNTLPTDLAADGGDWLPDLNVSVTNLTTTIYPGQTAVAQSFELWKATNWYPLVYTSAVSTNWLQVSPSSGTNTGEHLAVSVTYTNTSSLTMGTNTATIVVSGRDPEFGFQARGSAQTIQVSVVVRTPPALQVSPGGLTNVVSEGHRPAGHTVRVWNGSGAPREPLAYTVTKDQSWITVSPTNGTCTDNTNTFSVTYNTTTLSAGVHTGVVSVGSSGFGATTQAVSVIMRVNATPVVSVSASGWTNVISHGGSLDSVTFNVWNGSAAPCGTLKYQLSDNMDWVSLSEGGTSTGQQSSVTVTFATAGLAQGVYTGSVTVTGSDEITGDTASGSPQQLGVKLTVNGGVTMATSLRGFTNTVLQGYAETNTFMIWNSSGEPYGPMAYTVSGDASWLSMSPVSGTVTNNTNTISVVFTTGSLSPGTYTGSIVVDATDAQTSSRAPGAPQTNVAVLIVESRTPQNFELPEIRGIPHLGQELEVDKGLWQNEDRLTFSYQWQKASEAVASGATSISGATGTTYVVSELDEGVFLRVRVSAVDSVPVPLSTTVYSEFQNAMKIRATEEDFSGDGRTDLWFFDAAAGTWRMAYSEGGTAELQFGWWETEAVPGDYDGNGVLDYAVYYPDDGMWYVLFMPSGQFATLQFGWWETEPIVGDYDGDGTTDIAVYWPTGGVWFILKSSTWTLEYTQFGWSETEPVPGDYDGDGITDMALYYNGTWTVQTAAGDYWTQEFGGSDGYPAAGDYDGDGIMDLAVYWYAENRWEILLSSTGEIREESFGTSNGAGIPMHGYYDYDSECDPATVHVSGEFLIWCIQRSSDGYRGQSYQADNNMWRVSW